MTQGTRPFFGESMTRSFTCCFRRRNFLAVMMVRAITTLPLLMLATHARADAQTRAVEQPEKADHAAADVSLIAAWIVEANKPAPFKHPFGDQHFFTDVDDAQFYTDVQGVDVPDKLRRVSYDFIKARMDLIRNGRRRDPAVLITRSVLNEPETVRLGKQALKRMQEPGERVYYIEVAIGNLAWHGMKILVYEDDGRKKVKILSSSTS
jgi:hypothetical protein